ncbi:MAG: RNA polymerase sigma factor [Gemmataceae bacterium]
MNWMEIEILVEQAQAGNREAFGELAQRFEKAVLAAAFAKLRDFNEAQELSQEVFVQAMRKLPQLREPRAFAGWLRRMTARMAINRLTRRGPVLGADTAFLNEVPGTQRTPDEDVELGEMRAGLYAGLRQLKSVDRQTLEAFYLRGQSVQEMADEFATPVGTIKRRLHVARGRLKDVLEPTLGESSRELALATA